MNLYRIYSKFLKRAVTKSDVLYQEDDEHIYFGDPYHIYRFPRALVPVDFARTNATQMTSLSKLFRDCNCQLIMTSTIHVTGKKETVCFEVSKMTNHAMTYWLNKEYVDEAQFDGTCGAYVEDVTKPLYPVMFQNEEFGVYAVILPVRRYDE